MNRRDEITTAWNLGERPRWTDKRTQILTLGGGRRVTVRKAGELTAAGRLLQEKGWHAQPEGFD